MGLLDVLRRIFARFGPAGDSGTQGAQRGELRAIAQRLRAHKPALYRARGRVLLPSVAERLYQLHRALEPLKLVFRYTISHDDAETRQRFLDWLVEARLPVGSEDRRFTFTYKDMRRQIVPGASVEAQLKAIAERFDRYIANLGAEAYGGFDAAMDETLRLASLCRFDFERLLRRYDARLDTTRTDYRPSFSDVPVDETLDEMLDLYFVLARLQLPDGVLRNVRNLGSRVFRDERYDPEGIARSVEAVRVILREVLPPQLLLDLIRIGKDDGAYAPKADQSRGEYLADFKKKATEQYNADRERIAREEGRAALDADVKALFEGVDLLELQGYNDGENTMILRRGLDGYDLVFPLRILKSFAVARYENRLMDLVKRLIVEGAFRDRKFQESLSTASVGCEGIRARIEEFEGSFGDGGAFSLRTIHKSLEAHQKGRAAVTAEVKRLLRGINRQARQVLEQSAGTYHRLGSLLRDVISDTRVRTPDHVVNIRVIDGDNNRAFIAGLTAGYNDIARLLQVIKQFAVPQTDAGRQAVEKPLAAETEGT
jgi:hypothetical protein